MCGGCEGGGGVREGWRRSDVGWLGGDDGGVTEYSVVEFDSERAAARARLGLHCGVRSPVSGVAKAC